MAPLYDATCIPLTGYSTKMAFDIGEHRNLAEINERDILSIPLDLDISVGQFDNAVKQIVEALTQAASSTLDENANVNAMVKQILENSKPRLEVLEKYLSL
jgi:serine/threonine-protein kinase HipA